MQGFAAIDIETSNNERSSVCSVGVVGRLWIPQPRHHCRTLRI